jgi:MFS family permease
MRLSSRETAIGRGIIAANQSEPVSTSPVRTNGHELGAIGVVVGCTLGNLVSVTPVINGTFGIFLVPVTQALGWTRTELSVVLLIMAIVGVVGYPVAGYFADRYGVRPVALIGNASFAVCVAGLALSSSQHLWVYALYAITGLVATFSSCVLLMKPVSLWFTRHRGLLFAVTGAFGINIGIAAIPFLVTYILGEHGWRAAYVGLGAFTLLVGFPSMLLLKNPPAGVIGAAAPEMPLPGMTSREARRQPVFWLLMFSVALGAGSLSAMLTHMVPLLTDRGIPLTTATTAFATTALCNASWQIVIGMMLDRTKAPRFAGIFLIVSIVGLVLIGCMSGSAWLMVGAVLLGIGSGTEYGLLPCVIPRYFGVRSFSELYGMIFGVSILVSGFTPLLMGLAFDTHGNYNMALIAIAVALAFSAVLIFSMPSYGTRWRPGVLANEAGAEPSTKLAALR